MNQAAKNKNLKNLQKLKKQIEEEGSVHTDDLDSLGFNIFDAKWVKEIPNPSKCVYCGADWSPDMVELYETSGYCETCYSGESVIDVFCTSCGKLVYRKEIR